MSSLQNFLEIVPVVFAAGESKLFHLGGAYFEIIDAPDPVDVVLTDKNGVQRGVMRNAEASFYIKNTGYDTIQLTSATAQTIRFAFGSSEAGTRRSTGSVTISGNVALDAATLAALESVDLNAATLATIRQPLLSTGWFIGTAALAANTPDTIFTPAGNVSGAVVLTAEFSIFGGAGIPAAAFVAHTAAPANISTGEHILGAGMVSNTSGGNTCTNGRLPCAQYIAAGKGLYFISDTASGGAVVPGNSYRSCRYRLL